MLEAAEYERRRYFLTSECVFSSINSSARTLRSYRLFLGTREEKSNIRSSRNLYAFHQKLFSRITWVSSSYPNRPPLFITVVVEAIFWVITTTPAAYECQCSSKDESKQTYNVERQMYAFLLASCCYADASSLGLWWRLLWPYWCFLQCSWQ